MQCGVELANPIELPVEILRRDGWFGPSRHNAGSPADGGLWRCSAHRSQSPRPAQARPVEAGPYADAARCRNACFAKPAANRSDIQTKRQGNFDLLVVRRHAQLALRIRAHIQARVMFRAKSPAGHGSRGGRTTRAAASFRRSNRSPCARVASTCFGDIFSGRCHGGRSPRPRRR